MKLDSIKIARIYLRVSTDEQDLTRQTGIEQSTRAVGYYIAATSLRRTNSEARCRERHKTQRTPAPWLCLAARA